MYEMFSLHTPNPANTNMLDVDPSLCDRAYLEAILASFLKS